MNNKILLHKRDAWPTNGKKETPHTSNQQKMQGLKVFERALEICLGSYKDEPDML